MIFRPLTIMLVTCCLALNAHGQAEMESSKNQLPTNPLAATIDLNAENLDRELNKARLIVELRQSELDTIVESNFDVANVEAEIIAMTKQQQPAQAKLVVARTHLDMVQRRLKEAEKESDRKKLSEELHVASGRVESEEARLEELAAKLALANRSIAAMNRKRAAGIRKAEIAVELAKLQRDSVEEAMAARIKKKNAPSSPPTPPKFKPLESVGLTKEDLADCKLHVIGLYRASNDRSSDEVFVEVQDLNEPAVVVVSAYSEVLWRVKLAKNANVKLVIVAGYYTQAATIIGSDVPVLNLTYFRGKKTNRNRPWAYAYSWRTAEGRKMANMLYDVTGLTVDTFQGLESARRLVIDGQKGKLTNRQAKEPIPGLLTDAEREAEPIEFPDETATESEKPTAVKTDVDELYAGEASVKIVMRKVSEELKRVDAKLTEVDAKVDRFVASAEPSDGETNDDFRAKLKNALTEQFQWQQKQREVRVKLAGAKLQLVEVRRMLRETQADEIISKKLQELLE